MILDRLRELLQDRSRTASAKISAQKKRFALTVGYLKYVES
jgi:hypothetical protein